MTKLTQTSIPWNANRRQFLAFGAGALALGLNPALLQAEAADFSGVTLHAAQYTGGDDEKLLKAAGLIDTPYKVEFSTFSGGNLIVEAINGGSIDVGGMSETPPIFGAISGAAIKIVGITKDDTNWQVVLVPKGSTAQTIADLKGKRVGYVRATTTHYYLAKMLKEAGLSFKDIDAVALTPTDGQAAFNQGALDAFAIYGYNVAFALANGARVLKTATGYLSGNYTVAARTGALEDPKLAAAIGDYLVRLKAAYAWRGQHKQKWADIWSKAIGVPSDIILRILTENSQDRGLYQITDKDIASAQNVADTFFELGVIPRQVDVKPLFDQRYNENLGKAV